MLIKGAPGLSLRKNSISHQENVKYFPWVWYAKELYYVPSANLLFKSLKYIQRTFSIWYIFIGTLLIYSLLGISDAIYQHNILVSFWQVLLFSKPFSLKCIIAGHPVPLLLTPWLVALPGLQQALHWPCRTNASMLSKTRNSNMW